jgi:hypothetical protein
LAYFKQARDRQQQKKYNSIECLRLTPMTRPKGKIASQRSL